MTGIILWVIFGAIAGWSASFVMRTNKSHGLVTDIVLGIAGAIVGGIIANLLGQSGVTGFNLYSLFVAALGGVILIWFGRLVYK